MEPALIIFITILAIAIVTLVVLHLIMPTHTTPEESQKTSNFELPRDSWWETVKNNPSPSPDNDPNLGGDTLKQVVR